MSYEIKKIEEEREERNQLDDLVEKLEDIKLRLTPLEPIILKHKFDKEEEVIFDPPLRSKFLIYSKPYEKVIVYNNQSFEVVSIKTHNSSEYYEPALVIRSTTSTFTLPLTFSELLGFLFYSGGYEQIRYRGYEENNELINIILDVGELTYDYTYDYTLPQILQGSIRESDYIITYTIKWNKPSQETRYVGISIEKYKYFMLLLDEELKEKIQISLVRYKRDTIDPIWIKINTFSKLSIVRNMLETLNKERNEIEKYITSLKLAYIGTVTYNSILR